MQIRVEGAYHHAQLLSGWQRLGTSWGLRQVSRFCEDLRRHFWQVPVQSMAEADTS